MNDYPLCAGMGLPPCLDCRRNLDNNDPAAGRDPYRARLRPRTRERQCGDWLAIPAKPYDAGIERP